MPKRVPLGAEERGVSPMIGAAVALAIVMMALTTYVKDVVPAYEKASEADYTNELRTTVLKIQSAILSGTSTEIPIKMSPDPPQYFAPPRPHTTIEVTPARWVKRFQPIADAYVDQGTPNSNFGSDNVLSVRSWVQGATQRNRHAYLKFSTAELAGISSGSVSEVWLALYAENITKFMAAPWGDARFDPRENTLPVDRFYLPDLPIEVEVRTVSSQNWAEGSITWNNKPAYGDTIKSIGWLAEDSHVIKENEVWYTWDITTWVREQMKSGAENISVMLKPRADGSTQERMANFSSRNSPGIPVLNPLSFYDPDGSESDDKVTGHPPYIKPYLAIFYENGTQPGPPVYDNWGALVEDGKIRFGTNYYEYPSTSFVFEHGAIFQQLYFGAYTLMISDPGLVVGERLDVDTYHDNIAVHLNRYRIVNRDSFDSSSPVKLKLNIKENTDYQIVPTDTDGDGYPNGNRENVMITLNTEFEWPWKYYARDLTYRWNASVNKGGMEWWVEHNQNILESGTGPRGTDYTDNDYFGGNLIEFIAKMYVDKNNRFYIWGNVVDPSIKDILYYDRTYDVEVEVVV
ncbi:MAG: DNRLRE domain-containing protein [Candidatus Hadarchaeota archaeon]